MTDDSEDLNVRNEENIQMVDEVLQKLLEVERKVDILYRFRDHYFEEHSLEKAAVKSNDIESKKLEILLEFDQINEELLIGIKKANYYFLKGKLLNVCSDFDQKSITYLSKALKLNPKLTEAWNELGESYWKENNIKEANNCFEVALTHSRNPTSLRNLSIILRQSPTNDFQEKKKNIKKSIDLAKEAIHFDLTNGLSWLCYGNALLYSYFSICQDEFMLKNVLKAYKMAEGHKITANQSDLHFNKAMALKYSEEYSDALYHFEFASKLDPEWELPGLEKETLVKYLKTVVDSLNSKGKLKAKRIAEMVHSVSLLAKNYAECIAINTSETGMCTGKLIIGKVICSIRSDNYVPFSFCLLDHQGNTALVTVYNLASGAGVIIGDLVKISDPNFKKQEISFANSNMKFSSVRVDDPTKMVVNGKPISSSKMASASILSSYRA